MSIYGICGRPRKGKTTFATMIALEYVARYSKSKNADLHERKVFSNFPIHSDHVYKLESFEQMLNLHNCVIFLDEFASWFDRREYRKTDSADLSRFRQSGHDAVEIWWIAHHITDVETKIAKTLTDEIWEVRRQFGPDLDGLPTPIEKAVGWWSTARRFHSSDYESAKRVSTASRRFRIDKFIHLYDSYYVIGDRAGEGARPGRAAAACPRAHARTTAPPHKQPSIL